MGLPLVRVARKLAWQRAVSSLLALLLLPMAAAAHELRPAVADIEVGADTVRWEVTISAEAMLAGVDQSAGGDTDDTPQAEAYDGFRALSDAELSAALETEWPGLARGFTVSSGGVPVAMRLEAIAVIAEPDLELPRDTRITVVGDLPESDAPVILGWQSLYGGLVVRQVGGGDAAYQGFLENGAVSDPLPRGEILEESAGAVFLRYIVAGFDHIIPKGLDHILFVLGLFFFALHLKPILWQVTAFTLAHTITLALASLEVIVLPGYVVEPLIAASISYVAIENILRPKLGWWRTAVVFGFGLLHGLGFASVLGDFGLAPGRFVVGLVAFNIGVELGQLAVILGAAVLIWLAVRAARIAALEPEEDPVRAHDVMYRAVSIFGSLVIALIGIYWVLERTPWGMFGF